MPISAGGCYIILEEPGASRACSRWEQAPLGIRAWHIMEELGGDPSDGVSLVHWLHATGLPRKKSLSKCDHLWSFDTISSVGSMKCSVV